MLITKIIGGLGNQMFQYAAGRALAIKNNNSLYLDVSDFKDYQLHQGFELHRIFSCEGFVANDLNLREVLGWQSSTVVRRLVSQSKISFLKSGNFVVEPHFNYWSGINNIPLNSYLSGYWQSERYFLDQAACIRSDFEFKLPMSELNSGFAGRIVKSNSISLHVRRGDYVSNPKAATTHGLCTLDYYNSAIKYISERVANPEFYIFSDDILWVKNNLTINFPHQYVNHNHGIESYNDMRLMSLCKHHVIANSSFSWWGAWLNPSAQKIVVAPKRWFANKTNSDDLIPNSWVVL